MPYKIINNKEEYIRQYNIIMSEYQLRFNLSRECIICDNNINGENNKGVFDLSRLDLFESLKEISSIITDEWLNTGIIGELPIDWIWPYPTDPIKITIPNSLILKDADLRSLIDYAIMMEINYIIDDMNTYLYVSYIKEEQQILFSQEKYKDLIVIIKQ